VVPLKEKLCDSRSCAEVLRGGKINRDTGMAMVDPARDRPSRIGGEPHNPQRADDFASNVTGGQNQRFNNGWRGAQKGNQFRGRYGRFGGQGGGDNFARDANLNPRPGVGATREGWMRGMVRALRRIWRCDLN
jgi:hypothetical protein